MKKWFWIGCLLLLIPQWVWAKASFTVAPGIIEFDISKPSTQTFLIINSGDERIRLFIRPIYFPIDSKSLSAGTSLNPKIQEIEDLSELILISPRVLSLNPGQRRNVRMSVRPSKQFSQGDYRAHLLIRTLGNPNESKPSEDSNPDGGMKIQLNIKLETAVAVYGRIGNPKIDLKWKCLKDSNDQLKLILINESPWRFSGWIGVFDNTGKPLASNALKRIVSLRESKREIHMNAPVSDTMELRWGSSQNDLSAGSYRCNLSE